MKHDHERLSTMPIRTAAKPRTAFQEIGWSALAAVTVWNLLLRQGVITSLRHDRSGPSLLSCTCSPGLDPGLAGADRDASA